MIIKIVDSNGKVLFCIPEAFAEVRYLEHHKQMEALEIIPTLQKEFSEQFGRESGGLISEYRTEGAYTIIIALGSVNGTIQDVVDEMREDNVPIGSVSICSFRPFPLKELRAAVSHAKRVVVVEKCLEVGLGGTVTPNVRMSLRGLAFLIYTAIAGLVGRPITKKSLRQLFENARKDELEETNFLDMNWDIVNKEIDRSRETRLSGPSAENILRHVGSVASDIA